MSQINVPLAFPFFVCPLTVSVVFILACMSLI